MPQSERLQQQIEELREHFDLLSEKISELRKAYAIETDPAITFKLKQQIDAVETDRALIERQLNILETITKSGSHSTPYKIAVVLCLLFLLFSGYSYYQASQSNGRLENLIRSANNMPGVNIADYDQLNNYIRSLIQKNNPPHEDLSSLNQVNEDLSNKLRELEIENKQLRIQQEPKGGYVHWYEIGSLEVVDDPREGKRLRITPKKPLIPKGEFIGHPDCPNIWSGGGVISTLPIGHEATGITQEKLKEMIRKVREAKEKGYMIRHYTPCLDGNSLYIEEIQVNEK